MAILFVDYFGSLVITLYHHLKMGIIRIIQEPKIFNNLIISALIPITNI